MPKLYVISDVHGFYDEMRTALDKAGFDPTDENSWLISCGDVWDRGNKPLEVMNYLLSLPRAVLISGNHSLLFKECCRRGFPYRYDIHNGTCETIYKLGRKCDEDSFTDCCANAEKVARPMLDREVNYFETEHYVFCHAWVPVDSIDWRSAGQREWNDAMWYNPLDMGKTCIAVGKTIVSGHIPCSYGWAAKDSSFDKSGQNANFEPFFCEDKFIMIDACTAYSGKVNVLVLEDNFLT